MLQSSKDGNNNIKRGSQDREYVALWHRRLLLHYFTTKEMYTNCLPRH